MHTNQYDFQLLISDVQALDSKQKQLSIYIPLSAKTADIFKTLLQLKASYPNYTDNPQTDFKHQLSTAIDSDPAIIRPLVEGFEHTYRVLFEISNLIINEPEDATKSNIQNILGTNLIIYEQLYTDFYEVLMIEFALNEKPALVELATIAIKIVRLIKEISGGQLNTKNDIVSYFHQLKVILPDEIFPIIHQAKDLTSAVDNSSYLQDQESEKRTIDQIRATKHAKAQLELIYTHKINQIRARVLTEEEFCANLQLSNRDDQDDQKEELDCEKSYQAYLAQLEVERLDKESFKKEGFSDESRNIVESLGVDINRGVNVYQLFRRLDERVANLSAQINVEPGFNQIVRLGSSVVSVNYDAFEKQICGQTERLSHCDLLRAIRAEIPEEPIVQILGVGHHQVIRDQHLRYETSALAHNEAVLMGEDKVNVFRKLQRTETYTESESEREEERTEDQRTSDRFELGKEIARQNSLSTQQSAGLKISSYGAVNVQASGSFASQSANAQQTKMAVKEAKETVTRSVNKVKEKTRVLRSSRSIDETEHTATHSISNSTTPIGHINGWYQHIDEVREFRVLNIGQRLVLRIVLPVPAAFDIYAASQARPEGVSIPKPIPPAQYESTYMRHLRSFKDIDRDNYGLWAALYGVSDIEAPPEGFLTVSKAYHKKLVEEGSEWNNYSFNDLIVKEGYEAISGQLNIAFSSGRGRYISGYLGNKVFSTSIGRNFNLVLDGEDDVIPVAFRGRFEEFAMTIEIKTKLTTQAYDKWRVKTFDAIMNAYQRKKAAFDNQMALLQVQEGIQIEGRNPLANQKIIDTALERGCIDMLTKGGYRGYETVKYARTGEPETDYAEVYRQTPFLHFFSNAFEWHNKTYAFKAWYWASYPQWKVLTQFEDKDQRFQDFIQAGAAVVDLPIRPAYTQAVLNFIATGEIWDFQNMPTLNDRMHISIMQMIQNSQQQTGGVLVGQPWEDVIPTGEIVVKDPPTSLI